MGKDNRTNTYQTANDLKSVVGQNLTSVTLLGKDSPNDGFAGTFFWDSTSTLPEDNVDVIQRTGISTGRWIRARSLPITQEQIEAIEAAVLASQDISVETYEDMISLVEAERDSETGKGLWIYVTSTQRVYKYFKSSNTLLWIAAVTQEL